MSVPRTLIHNGCSFKSFLVLNERRLHSVLATSQIARAQLSLNGVPSPKRCWSDKSTDRGSTDKSSKLQGGGDEKSQKSETKSDDESSKTIALSTDHLLTHKTIDGGHPRVIPPESEGEEERSKRVSKGAEHKFASPTVVLIPRIPTSAKEMRPIFVPPADDELTLEDMIPPTNCCMSGCPNCVWIDYVEKLTKFYSSPEVGRDRVHHDIETIDDPNIKAWLIMDLKLKGLW